MSWLNRCVMTRVSRAAIVGATLGLVGVSLMYMAGYRVNTSESIRVGVYRVTTESAVKGDYVIFCPPARDLFFVALKRGYIDAGFCPGGLGQMMKRILAAKGDSVEIAPQGVIVNGTLLPHSAPIGADAHGRRLPSLIGAHYTLGARDFLLMTDINPASFDGRYFGPLSTDQIEAVIKPVITW